MASTLAAVSAICFFMGAISQIIATNVEHGNRWNDPNVLVNPMGLPPPHPEWTEEERRAHWHARFDARMRGDKLTERWEARRKAKAPYFVGTFASGAAWFLALPAIEILASVLGGSQRSASTFVRLSFVVAAMLTIVEFISEAGVQCAPSNLEHLSPQP